MVRPEQMRVAREISNLIDEQTGRIIIAVKASTGFGKTEGIILGGLLSNHISRIFYTAPRKDLQTQAFQTAQKFIDLNNGWTCNWLRGRNNYPCILKEGETVDNCISTAYRHCKHKPQPVKDYPQDTKHWFETKRGSIKTIPEICCPYYAKKAEVTMRKVNPDITVFTSHYTIAEALSAGEIFPADYLIFDEGRHVESLFVDATAVSFDEGLLKYVFGEDFPISCDVENYASVKNYLSIVKVELQSRVEFILAETKDAMTRNDALRATKRHDVATRLIDSISYLLDNWDGSNIVIDSPRVFRKNRTYNSLRVRFLDISAIFHKFVHEMVTPEGAIILMSATMPSEEELRQILKIDDKGDYRFKYLIGNSDWNKKNRPVVLMRGFRLNAGNIDEKKYEMLPVVKSIVDEVTGRNKNIVIHTHNNRLKEFFVDGFFGDNRLMSHNVKDVFDCTAEQAVELFKKSTGKVFISASIGEGSSFDDDICRIQLILKAPYPDMTDPWVKRKSTVDRRFMSREARLNLEQMIGRIIRNSNDFGLTIIMDSAVFGLFMTEKPIGFAWDNLMGFSKNEPVSSETILHVVKNFLDNGSAGILNGVAIAQSQKNTEINREVNSRAIKGLGSMMRGK